jgi:hypothetical protein
MHSAWCSMLSLVLSGIPARGPPAGWTYLRHTCAADLNAGEFVTASGILGPSGKFGTPCERMHTANASCGLTEAPVRLELPNDPQAASVSVQAAAATAIRYWLHRRLLTRSVLRERV